MFHVTQECPWKGDILAKILASVLFNLHEICFTLSETIVDSTL